MFAGTAIAAAVWGVLQLLGLGVGLVAIDPDDATSVMPAAVGTTAFSTLAPLIAMFVGGFVAARLANTNDKRIAVTHGLVTWGLASVAGLVTTVLVVSALGHGAARVETGPRAAAQNEVATDARIADAEDALVPINQRLRTEGKPQITTQQLLAAARNAHDDDSYDRDDFVEQLDELTALDKAEATRVVDQLGSRAAGLVTMAATPTPMEHDVMRGLEKAGKGLLALGLAMLISIATAVAGALIALRADDRTRMTAPYPVQDPPV